MTDPLSSCAILLPAYRAGDSLRPLLTDLTLIISPDRIAVVNDGSPDNTDQVIRDAGVHLVQHETNRGKGAALRTGIEWWLARSDWKVVVTMDADGQHAPGDISALVAVWRRSDVDIVIGKRNFADPGMPLERRLSNSITSALVSWKTGQTVEDSQCGFRLLSRRVVERVRWIADGYEAETEMLFRAASLGFRIAAAPIRTIYAGERSSMTRWTTTKAFVRTLLRNY